MDEQTSAGVLAASYVYAYVRENAEVAAAVYPVGPGVATADGPNRPCRLIGCEAQARSDGRANCHARRSDERPSASAVMLRTTYQTPRRGIATLIPSDG